MAPNNLAASTFGRSERKNGMNSDVTNASGHLLKNYVFFVDALVCKTVTRRRGAANGVQLPEADPRNDGRRVQRGCLLVEGFGLAGRGVRVSYIRQIVSSDHFSVFSGGGAKVGVVENWGIACIVFQRSAIDLVQLRVIPFCTEGILDYVNVGFERIE